MNLAEIVNDEIVIRIPIEVIKEAAEIAFDEEYGYSNHTYTVVDPKAFAEEMVLEMNAKGDDPGLLVKFLDSIAVLALENGAEGISEHRYEDESEDSD